MSNELSLNKKLISHPLKGKLPQLWGGCTWLTPGYGHLSLKALPCWEGLNHTKNDQPGKYETGWVIYELCLLSPLERVIGMELSGFVALIYGLHTFRDGYEGVAWDSHEFKVIPGNELEVTLTSLLLV